jgi:hypothetical protein
MRTVFLQRARTTHENHPPKAMLVCNGRRFLGRRGKACWIGVNTFYNHHGILAIFTGLAPLSL